MGKNDLRQAYPQLEPDREYPPLHLQSLKGKVSATEWETRVDCACAYRLVKHFGMDDHIAYRLECVCRTQLLAQGCHDEVLLPSREVFEKTARMYQPGVRRTMGLLEWPAMRRLADRRDPSYKN